MSGVAELVALVDRLQAEAREHAATAAMWQERAGTLADRFVVAETKLLELAAPAESPGAGHQAASISGMALGSSSTHPWTRWRWWLVLLTVVLAVGTAGALLLDFR
jgi:hypothetical protein